MKLVFIYDAVFPYVLGGAERHVYEIAVRLGKRHDVHLLAMKCWPGPDTIELAPGVWAHGICPVPRGAIKGSCFTRTIPQVLRYAARIPRAVKALAPVDIIDCTSIPYFPLFAAKLASWTHRVPLASIWLESWTPKTWRQYMGPVKGLAGIIVEKITTRLPRRLLPISEHTRQGLLSMGVSDDKIRVITPGIDWQRIQDTPAGSSACDIIFVGRLIPDKGVDMLLDAMAIVSKHRRVRCTIIGDGPEKTALEAQAAALGLAEQVTFTGSVDNVYPYLKAATVLVHPSRREGFGITPIEAAACALPVITVDEPGNAAKELVKDGNLGAVCPADSQALADAILTALEDSFRAQHGEPARQWARQFDWDNKAAQFEHEYERLMQEASRVKG